MKRLYLALSLILLIAAAAIFHANNLISLSRELSYTLQEAQHAAEVGQPFEALRLTSLAEEKFLERGPYLHTTLNHKTIDGIQTSFSMILSHLRSGESGPAYIAANSALILQLQLLAEAEQPSLKNIL